MHTYAISSLFLLHDGMMLCQQVTRACSCWPFSRLSDDCSISVLIPLNLMVHGHPQVTGIIQGILQWLGGQSDAATTWQRSSLEPAWVTFPKKQSRLSRITWETGGQPAVCLTVAMVICPIYGIRRILWRDHVSKVSRRAARDLPDYSTMWNMQTLVPCWLCSQRGIPAPIYSHSIGFDTAAPGEHRLCTS